VTGKAVKFDASGSYQYSQLATRQYVADADLQFKWDFGDGSPAAFGKKVQHSYRTANEAPYKVTLTVTNRDTHKSDTATRAVLVEACSDNCANDSDPDQSGDPGLRAQGSVVACQSGGGFTSVKVTPAGRGLRFEGASPSGGFTAEVFLAAKGRRATTPKRVASFDVNGSYTWDGQKPELADGTYFVRVSTRGTGVRPDVRGFGFDRKGARFTARKPFQRPDSCELLSLARLDAPAVGGKRALDVAITTTKAARVTVSVFRGNAAKAVKRFKKTTSPNRLLKVALAPRKLERGEYRIAIAATAEGKTQRATLYARKY
jgi:PKD repeat protein